MASTNKTENFDLNQWAETDPVIRTDFNADNQKIDAALAAQPWEKLMETTTESDVAQIELDLSTIDMTKYSALKINIDGQTKSTSSSAVPTINLQFNNNAESIYYSGNGSDSAYDQKYIQLTSTMKFGGGGVAEIIPCYTGTAVFSSYIGLASNADSVNAGIYNSFARGIQFQDLTSMQFLAMYSGNTTNHSISTGFHITLWGVKA